MGSLRSYWGLVVSATVAVVVVAWGIGTLVRLADTTTATTVIN